MEEVTYKGKSYFIPSGLKTREQKISALRDEIKKQKESAPKASPLGAFIRTPVDPKTLEPTEESRALDLLALNQILGLGIPSKLASEVGFEAPQAAVEQARKMTGGYGVASEVVGGLPTAVGVGKGLLKAGKRYLPQIPAATRGLLTSATEGLGAYYGATSRGEMTPTGAAVSAIAPAAITGVATLGGKAAEFASRPARERALRTIGEYMGAPRGPAATITSAEDIARVAGEKRPITIAEQVGGEAEGLEPLVSRALAEAGPETRIGRDIVIGKMTARAEGRPARVFESAEGFPTSKRVDELIEKIELDKADVSDIYKQAHEAPFEVTKDFSDLAKRPSFVGSAKGAVKLAEEEGRSITWVETIKVGDEVTRQTVKLKPSHLQSPAKLKEVLETTENPSLIVDYMIRGVDDKIAKTKKPQEKRAMLNTKYELLDVVGEINPSYLNARNSYSGVMARKNAIDFGKDIMKMPEGEFTTLVSKMSDDEKEYFAVGVMDFIKEELGKPNLGVLKTVKTGDFENKITRRLRPAFPSDEAFSKFANNLAEEQKMLGLERISKMSVKDTENVLNRITSALYVRQRAGGGTPSAFVNVSNAVRRLLGGGMAPDEADEIIDILMRNTPKGRKEVLDELVRAETISSKVAEEVQESLLPITTPVTLTAAQIAPTEE